MGREARCLCKWGSAEFQVAALLESTEIVFRGELKRKIPIAELRHVQTQPDGLHFIFGTQSVNLALPAAEAAAWARKIATPPPSLRQKLGLGADVKAFVLGARGNAELAEALQGSTPTTAADAAMLVAIVTDEPDLQAALRVHADMPPRAPIWVVHRKGRTANFGETRVRACMRAAGFIDTKVAAVSAALTAVRYAKQGGLPARAK